MEMPPDISDLTVPSNRCPICKKNLTVIVSKVIYKHNEIRYCSTNCLDMGIKQSEEDKD